MRARSRARWRRTASVLSIPGALGAALLAGCVGDDPADDAVSTDDQALSLKLPTVDPYQVTNVGTYVATLAAKPGAIVLGGDFNGDDRTDVAVLGASGSSIVAIGLARGDGSFSLEYRFASGFAGKAMQPGVQAVVGDFDGDGLSDIALAGGASWTTVPVAFSRGSSFTVTDRPSQTFAIQARYPGVALRAGDVDGNGLDDLLLIGSAAEQAVAVGRSLGNGEFSSFLMHSLGIRGLLDAPGVQIAVGDFDDNGLADVALAGGAGWSTVPVYLNTGEDTFALTQPEGGSFATWARVAGAALAVGDSDGDGRDDLLLIGGHGWSSIPAALSRTVRVVDEQTHVPRSELRFTIENVAASQLAAWAARDEVTPIVGDHDRDGLDDVTLAGGSYWTSVPVGMRRRLHFSPPVSPEERGEVSLPGLSADGCDALVDDAMQALCDVMPGCSAPPATCATARAELAAGTTIFGADQPAWWPGLGGHGDALSRDALCMLKDLDQGVPPLVSEAGPVSAVQSLGLSSFDPVTRTVEGYQVVEMCAPLIGCLTAPSQRFTGTIRRSEPARPAGTGAGDYDTRGAYGFVMTADETSQQASFTGPNIPIITPLGEVDVVIQVSYHGDTRVVDQPVATMLQHAYLPGRPVEFDSLYGRSPVTQRIDAVDDDEAVGWWSQLSVGSRTAAPSITPWWGNSDRPDLDLSQPRSEREKTPTHHMTATTTATYNLGLPDWLPGNATLTVSLAIVYQTFATGQLAIAFTEGNYPDVDNPYTQSAVELRRGVNAADSLDVDIGVRFKADFGIYVVDEGHTFHVPVVEHAGSTPTGAATTKVITAPGAPARAQSLQTLGGDSYARTSAGVFVGRCLASQPWTAPVPAPTYEPTDDPFELDTPYPCNICVGEPNLVGGRHARVCPEGVACPVDAHAPGASGDWDCGGTTLGCYDMCRGPKSSPTVFRTAAQIEPGRCKVIPH
ncbi:MAG: VCBS repeat-containing protein [Kofleriaceae bacterium]|nr:VCBS repeat-containing protein [Kofleriaceae bacterium]